jgi:class 3 adenylate cyclase
MSKTKARFSFADVARATRAAKEQGAEAVEIKPDGTIRVIISGVAHKNEAKPETEKPKVRDFKL